MLICCTDLYIRPNLFYSNSSEEQHSEETSVHFTKAILEDCGPYTYIKIIQWLSQAYLSCQETFSLYGSWITLLIIVIFAKLVVHFY